MYSLTPRFRFGAEWNPLAKEVAPLANFHLVEEGRVRPAVIVGLSSDRIGTPNGTSVFLTASQDIRPLTGLPIAPYVGLAYGSYDDKTRFIAGANVSLPGQVSALVIMDGVHVHEVLSRDFGRHTLSVVLVRSKDVGVSYNVRF